MKPLIKIQIKQFYLSIKLKRNINYIFSIYNGLHIFITLFIMQSNSLFLSVLTKKKKKKKLFVMAADVSSLVRVLNRYKGDRTAGNDSKTTMSSLITQDLLGGGGGSASDHSINNEFQELDLDLQVPSGWEKRLDLKVNSFSHLGLFVSLEISLEMKRKQGSF